MAPRGSIPEGSSEVAASGKGSLSVTRPTGNRREGARPDSRLNTVASDRMRPPTSEVRQGVHRIAGGEVLNSEGPSQTTSGKRVSRRGAILLLR